MNLLTVKSNVSSFSDMLLDFTSLFFPECCQGCAAALAKGEEILCTRCIAELPRTGYLDFENNPMHEKFIGRVPIKHAWAFLRFRKAGIVQHLLHKLKYDDKPEIGVRLGRLFGKEIMDRGLSSAFDVIVPLPLFSSRQRSRGYNQSAKIAQGMSETLQLPLNTECCQRGRNTQTQTTKTKSERWGNVEAAFKIKDRIAIENKRILLVDDVITTGATLEACGGQLLKSGCYELSMACIAEAQ
jgi:ComF family protein